MSSGQKILTAFLTLIGGLLIVIIGLCTAWPWWCWPAAALTLLVLARLVSLSARRRRPTIPQEHLLEPDRPIPPVERWEKVVREVALPSASPDYDFLVTALVRWVPIDVAHGAPDVSGSGLAVDAVLTRARTITVTHPPHRGSLVQHQLAGALGTMEQDPTGRVLAMAENIQVSLSEADRERLEKLATVRKDEAVWEHERKWEQSKRAYLGEDVLASTGSAVVWWLAKNDDRVDKAVADIGLLAQLTSVANDEPIPAPLQPYVAPVAPDTPAAPEAEAAGAATDLFVAALQGLGLDEDDPARSLFLRRVAEAARAARLSGADALDRLATEEEERYRDPLPPEEAGDADGDLLAGGVTGL
ncbi:hypothetical protein GCM10017562_14970 [Streptomyces roseofulvus]|uniref:hypothetical protein n=1 Tax=Streptomyces roseofulvus TaxID=33902 RepID=UPI0031F9CEA6